MCDRNFHKSINFSIPAHFTLNIFATEKRVNHGVEYGQKTPANFNLYGHKKAIKLVIK